MNVLVGRTGRLNTCFFGVYGSANHVPVLIESHNQLCGVAAAFQVCRRDGDLINSIEEEVVLAPLQWPKGLT